MRAAGWATTPLPWCRSWTWPTTPRRPTPTSACAATRLSSTRSRTWTWTTRSASATLVRVAPRPCVTLRGRFASWARLAIATNALARRPSCRAAADDSGYTNQRWQATYGFVPEGGNLADRLTFELPEPSASPSVPPQGLVLARAQEALGLERFAEAVGGRHARLHAALRSLPWLPEDMEELARAAELEQKQGRASSPPPGARSAGSEGKEGGEQSPDVRLAQALRDQLQSELQGAFVLRSDACVCCWLVCGGFDTSSPCCPGARRLRHHGRGGRGGAVAAAPPPSAVGGRKGGQPGGGGPVPRGGVEVPARAQAAAAGGPGAPGQVPAAVTQAWPRLCAAARASDLTHPCAVPMRACGLCVCGARA